MHPFKHKEKELTMAELFLLLSHRPEGAGFLAVEQVKNAGLLGAIFLDLYLEKCISLENKRLKTLGPRTRLSDVHQEVLERLSRTERQKKVRTWISIMTRKAGRYRTTLLRFMKNKGLIRIEERHFLFIPYKKTYLTREPTRDQIIQVLREVVMGKKEADEQSTSLLSLLKACNLERILARDKKEKKIIRASVRDYLSKEPISQEVAHTIKEMQLAITAAIIASGSAAASHSH